MICAKQNKTEFIDWEKFVRTPFKVRGYLTAQLLRDVTTVRPPCSRYSLPHIYKAASQLIRQFSNYEKTLKLKTVR